ncbi:MAG: integrase [Nitrospirales bacterium]|nr:MAG: integrase [Nitrospirales bacterium]
MLLSLLMTKRPKAPIQKGPWNKGKAVGQKAPFTPDQVQIIRSLLVTEEKVRDLALFNVGIDTMLRASDVLPLTVADVTDHQGGVVSEIQVRQQKTNQGHLVALSPATQDSLADWLLQSSKRGADFLWTSLGNRKTHSHLSRAQYANLVKQWAELARLNPKRHSTHSMRRTKSAVIYDQTQNLAACQQLLGHKSIGSTAVYLGVDQRKALDLAKRIKL